MRRHFYGMIGFAALALAIPPQTRAADEIEGMAAVFIDDYYPANPGYWDVDIYYYHPKAGTINHVNVGWVGAGVGAYSSSVPCEKVFNDVINRRKWQHTLVDPVYSTAYPAGTQVHVAPSQFAMVCL